MLPPGPAPLSLPITDVISQGPCHHSTLPGHMGILGVLWDEPKGLLSPHFPKDLLGKVLVQHSGSCGGRTLGQKQDNLVKPRLSHSLAL